MKKPNDILVISKGKEKLKVSRKAYEVIYSQHEYKVVEDPSGDDVGGTQAVTTDDNSQ